MKDSVVTVVEIRHSWHVEQYKSFVYQESRWADPLTKSEIEIPIEPRANGRAICSGCGRPAPGYDRLSSRRFEFVPPWQIAVYFVYSMRRVDCPTCGVKVEKVPRCDGKNQLTTTYRCEAIVVERCCGGVWDNMAERVSLGKPCGFMGFGPNWNSPIDSGEEA